MLLQFEEVGSADPHVAFSLLCQCAGFCKMAHLARGTPPSQAIRPLILISTVASHDALRFEISDQS